MIRTAWMAALILPLGLAAAAPARADDGPKAICADRPTKGTSPCTVDPGHWQVEIDAADLTHDRSGGVTTDTGVFAGANLKYGVSDRLDLELNLPGLLTREVSGAGRASGLGDTVARAKLAVVQGAASISLLPFLKLPTASHDLGNGALEGGLVVPIALSLPGQTSLTLDPELDALKDAAGQGRHVAYALAAGLSRPLSETFTGSVEVWGAQDQEPGGHVSQASFDLGLAWIPMRDQNLQLDGGVNLGLNAATPGVQGYVGVSRRF
ncbi:MAG: hypothetical protein JWO72_305 [Caulobacteraceae bacterium]|nr:hypothetical protein [Caulobacteraceae bacterium]